MSIFKKILCFILKIIEEILMAILPNICGKNRLHLPSICEDMDRFIGAEDITIIQGTDFDPVEGVTAVDKDGNILPFTVQPDALPSLCELGTTTFVYKTETFVAERKVTVVQAPLPTISIPSGTSVGIGVQFDTLSGVTATDAHGNSLTVTCTEGSSVVFTSGGLKQLHYTATDACGNVGTATRAITVLAGHFSGVVNTSINQGETFGLTDGVTAESYDGQSVPFTVTPSTIDTCEVGTQTFTYEAQGVETATRTVTVNAIADPTISGISTTIEVGAGEEFDPLDGVTAVDGNGNTVAVTVSVKPTA